MKDSNAIELDVRPLLKEKKDPFQEIMSVVQSLKDDQEFILHALFKPTPLLGVMKLKGYQSQVEQLDEKHFKVTFRKARD